MPKKQASKPTAEQVAEKAKPNWRAVPPLPIDSARQSAPDEAVPEFDQLQQKYLGQRAGTASPAAGKKKKAANANDLKMVVMEPKSPSDTRVGRKAVLVDRGKIVGEQG